MLDIVPQHHLMENFTSSQADEADRVSHRLQVLLAKMTHDSSIKGALFCKGDTLDTAAAASAVVGPALNDGAGIGRVALQDSPN